jgi:hypothetical protein
MKRIFSLVFVFTIFVGVQSCNVNKGLAGLSPAQALNGVQALLGSTSQNALKGFAGNALSNAVIQKAMPKGLSNITSILGNTTQGTKALGLLNNAMGSALPDVATSVLGNFTKSIPAADALGILKGGKTGATDFVKKAAGNKLTNALLPVLTQKLTENGGLNAITSALGGQASSLLGSDKPSLASLATSGTVDGLFALMGEAEKKERANPTDPILKEIFGK